MQIGKDYKIESDSLNVTLYYKQTPRKVSQSESWRPMAFFSNPRDALEYMAKYEIMGAGLEDFKTVCKKIDELTGLISTLHGMPELLQSAPRYVKDKKRGNGQVEGVAA